MKDRVSLGQCLAAIDRICPWFSPALSLPIDPRPSRQLLIRSANNTCCGLASSAPLKDSTRESNASQRQVKVEIYRAGILVYSVNRLVKR
jgi:hypothetical protein